MSEFQVRDFIQEKPTTAELKLFRAMNDHFRRIEKSLPEGQEGEVEKGREFIQMYDNKKNWIIIHRSELPKWRSLGPAHKRQQAEAFQEKLRKGILVISGRQDDGVPVIMTREAAKKAGIVPTEIHYLAQPKIVQEVLSTDWLEIEAFKIDRDIALQTEKEEIVHKAGSGHLIQTQDGLVHIPGLIAITKPPMEDEFHREFSLLPNMLESQGKRYYLEIFRAGKDMIHLGWVTPAPEYYPLWTVEITRDGGIMQAVREAQAELLNRGVWEKLPVTDKNQA